MRIQIGSEAVDFVEVEAAGLLSKVRPAQRAVIIRLEVGDAEHVAAVPNRRGRAAVDAEDKLLLRGDGVSTQAGQRGVEEAAAWVGATAPQGDIAEEVKVVDDHAVMGREGIAQQQLERF